MKKPDIPEDEEQRLRVLRSLNILDTPQEERFDRLIRMAKLIFRVPIALVNLVDENRQWFKSCVGVSISETPREISFCGHAILGDDMFVISDTTKDDRFVGHPMVLNDPYIRFYAGYPLRFVDGSKLGTLCILDKRPRRLNVADLSALKDLALIAERELTAVYWATQDELTNTINRRGFMMLANHSINLCVRQKTPAILAFLDLNKFKLINDKFGHAEGDKVLTIFADLIKGICRESDLFARLGGDEFVILFVNASKRAVEDIFIRFQQSLDKYNQASDFGYNISFSYGIVAFEPAKHMTIEALLNDGDSLMYESKKKQGSRLSKTTQTGTQ